MSTDRNKLPHTRQTSRFQLLERQEGPNISQIQLIEDSTLHHIYDTNITATSLVPTDGRMAISRLTALEGLEILAKESDIALGKGNKVGRNPFDNNNSTTNINTNYQAPNDAVNALTIIDVISAPAIKEFPSGNKVYSLSINQGQHSNSFNLSHQFHLSFNQLTRPLAQWNEGTMPKSEYQSLQAVMKDVRTDINQASNSYNLNVGYGEPRAEYYHQVKDALIQLSHGRAPSKEFIQYCQWDRLPSSTPILTIVSNINSCANLVLDYEATVQESLSLSQVPVRLIKFLQQRLQSNVMVTPIPNLAKRTVVHLPPMDPNLLKYIVFTYQKFRKYVQTSRWQSSDMVPIIQDSLYSFTEIVSSVHTKSTIGFDHFTDHLTNVIKRYQLASISSNFPVELKVEIRQLTMLLEWMCQQITLVSVLQDEPTSDDPMFLVVKTYLMYHRYDYFLVIFLAMLDATETVNSELSYSLFTKKRIQPTLVREGPQPVIYTSIGLAGGVDVVVPHVTKRNAVSFSTIVDESIVAPISCPNFSSNISREVLKGVDVVVPHVTKRNAVSFSTIVDESIAAPINVSVPESSVAPVIYGRNRGYVHPIVEAQVTVPLFVPSIPIAGAAAPVYSNYANRNPSIDKVTATNSKPLLTITSPIIMITTTDSDYIATSKTASVYNESSNYVNMNDNDMKDHVMYPIYLLNSNTITTKYGDLSNPTMVPLSNKVPKSMVKVLQYRYYTIFSGKVRAKTSSRYQLLKLLVNPEQLDPFMMRRYIKNTEDNPNGDDCGIIYMIHIL